MKYAYFNLADGLVLQWIDTDALNCILPPADLLHICSEADWALQELPGRFMVSGGALVPYTEPAQPPAPGPSVPSSVSRFQARAALYAAGHFEAVESFMSQPETPMLMRLAWQDAQTFDRSSATVAALASALELSAEDVDGLFVAAAAITA